MKRDSILRGIYLLIVVVLLGGAVYFYYEAKKPYVNLSIGTPVSEDSVNYGNTINNKEVVNNIYLGLIRAKAIEKPEIVVELPTAIIKVDDREKKMSYISVRVWINQNKVIFAIDNGDETEYKEAVGDWSETFIDYISHYK